MTVICWDGKTLAADKLVSNKYSGYKTAKIGKLHDGSLYGWAGYPHQALRVIEWLNGERKSSEYPEQGDSDKGSSVIVISKRKKVTLYNDVAGGVEIADKVAAIGSGEPFALAAMYMGADAMQAVKVAIALCPSCGGGIDKLTL